MKDKETTRQGDKETGFPSESPCLPVSLSPGFRKGAIILCGGRSQRMGRDKAVLPFGPNETLLQRVVRLVSEAVPADHVICVAAPGQPLPELPDDVRVVFDPTPHAGPLAGLATGLAASEHEADAAFVAGCDALLLKPEFMARMFDLLGDYQIAAPHDGQRWHPLSAVYRTNLGRQIEELLQSGTRSLVALIESCRTRRVEASELRDVDPNLETLITCNTPEEYHAARECAAEVSRAGVKRQPAPD